MDGGLTLTILLYCVILSFPLIFMFISLHGRKKLGAKNDKTKKLPPGPPALLFLAKFISLEPSIFQIGPILRGLHARHGPIISIWLMRPFVFVADRRLAHSVLVEGGGNFDDRPPPSEMLGLFFPHTITTSTYGAYWRLVRRNLSSQALHPSRLRLFAPARQRALGAVSAGLLLQDPASQAVTVRPLLRRCLFELLVCMCLGVTLDQEALQELQEMLLQVFNAITAFPVFSFFPALTKRLLLRKRWARILALRDRRDQVLLRLIRARGGPGGGGGGGCGGGAEDQQVPCYADSLLELRMGEEGGRPLTDAEMVNLCSEFMIAATDTSLSMMEWIMAELVNRPDVQAKVYDEVRGHPDLSQGDMRGGMPYLKAVALEGLRLHPLGHLVIPHGVRSDGEVGGYLVPKGAELNFLLADLGLDETMWPAAREFRPERFLEDGDLDITGSRGIKMAPFGAGRRMCPGYTLAMQHAEFFVGSLVRDFQWLPPAQGQTTVDMTEDQASVICMKHPLRARIIPRTTT